MKHDQMYPLHALVHTFCAIVVLPYIALAIFFVLVAHIASSEGLWGALETTLKELEFILGTGIYVAPLLWVWLVAMGYIPSLQQAGSVCLGLLAVGSLIVVCIFPKASMEPGQILFIVPCIAVAVSCFLLVFRARIFG